MTTITALLTESKSLLNESRSGEIVLAYALKQSRAYLYTHPEQVLSPEELELFTTLIHRRAMGEPIAYLLGEKEFYSLNFKVTPDTLIPRPETEVLIDEALLLTPEEKKCNILELGVGSGAIAVTLAKLRPQANVLGTDISQAALDIAQKNAKQHDVNNTEFLLRDWFENLPMQKYNLIIQQSTLYRKS